MHYAAYTCHTTKVDIDFIKKILLTKTQTYTLISFFKRTGTETKPLNIYFLLQTRGSNLLYILNKIVITKVIITKDIMEHYTSRIFIFNFYSI